MDAKKSPLALLAQTCSSIGKDTTPSKSLIPPLEKSGKDGKASRSSPNHTKSDDSSSASGDGIKCRSKSPPSEGSSSSVSSTKGGRDTEKDGVRSPGSESSKSSFRAPPPKDIPPLVPIAHSPGSRKGSSTPEGSNVSGCSGSKDRERDREREKDSGSPGSDRGHAGSAGRSSAGLSSTSRISLSCGNMLLEVNHQEAVSAASKLSSPAHSATGSAAPSSSAAMSSLAMSSASMSMPLSVTSSLGGGSSMLKPLDGLHAPHPGMLGPGFSAYAGCLPLGLCHPLDAASMQAHSAYSAHSAMSAAAAAKHASASAHAGLSPYTYARVKTTSGATTLVPVCRDPYCTNCQITMQHTALTTPGATCAAGCTQCNHEKLSGATPLPPSSVASALSAGGLGPSVLGGLGASASSLYPHAFGVLPGHGLAYVCNWVAGSDYCGKRFATSEELLQHLRTHTASSDTAASLAAMQAAAYPGLAGLSMPSALATAAACHSHYPPGSLSPNSVRQAYGRMSPNTLLAASRYHPYSKSPLSGLHSAAPASLQGLPGAPSLGAYYSPYALYGQRLGAVP